MPRKKAPQVPLPPAPKTRRARGTGSIRKHKTRDVYVARVPVGKYPNGHTKFKEVSGTTHAETVEKMKAVEPPDPNTVTVGQWAARWLDGLSNRPSTRAAYSHSIGTRVVPDLGHVRLRDLKVSQVKAAAQSWLGARADGKLAPQTVNLTLDRAATMFAAASVDGLVTAANPFALCPRLEFERKPIDPFLEAELRAVVAAWRTCACGPLFAFMAATGVREGEALALDVTDYDTTTGAFRVTKTYHPKHGIGPPKSKHSVRAIDVPAAAGDARLAVEHAIGGRASGPLFATRTGRRLHHKQTYDGFAALCLALGLRKRSPHKMRHGVATTLIAHRVPIGDVAAWMGDTEEMIVKTYLHPTGHDVSAALGRVLAGKTDA